ncbi:PREDICTED: TBC domain-containing protein C1952.17c isoform X3 [Theobroma cacao]|uniref:TBC domain-containing protein C1952.17c isoform X3 n=2 Tax=Theobroma cacao TaxID=3641 RepID=A0AB32UQ24_THECC|nr:PREDICTED: TBC domain-containing protein C1952.17c isoform X3 [Theobroma cacao]EOY31075.1 Ypt/Rab-GAP domain of gyp1p superfamily protein isoform 5 [Theobroma cacao]
MLKGKKLKLPDRLGSLVVGFDDKDEDSGGSGSVFESGEELEIIQPNGFGSGRESETDDDGEIEEDAMVKRKVKVDGELEQKGRQRHEKDGSGHVLVMKIIQTDEKRSDIEYEISQKEVNLEKLQRIASTGLPDGGGLRATVWKLLLGYLPPSRDLWEKELTGNRQKYSKLKEELLLTPSELARIKEEALHSTEHNADSDTDGPLTRQKISHEDHPLSLGKSSVWHQYFEHTEIAEQIDRDLQRTHPEMKFFSGESSFSRKHREAMRNILLLFSKLNPAIRYVQGMNEVLAPLYYIFSTDIDEQNASNAEADSFSCFVRLMSDSVDHFCQQLDNSSVGILSTLSRLAELLKANDEELWRHLEFTSKDMLLRVCCAMLLCVKSRLLSGDFAANLKLLQHYPDINTEHLLQVARDLSPDTSSYRLSL